MKTAWLDIAFKYLGVTEISGSKHSSVITSWLLRLGAWWSDDETPWCGVFTGYVMKEAGYTIPKYYMRAKAWLDWGVPAMFPVQGCIAIFDRKGGGHVGFVVGQDVKGNLFVLGGNQGNKVSVAMFDKKRIVGYRLPVGSVASEMSAPKMVVSAMELSKNEA